MSALAFPILAFSALLRWTAAKFLNEFRTSRSTVAVALGVLPPVAAGDRSGVDFSDPLASADFVSGTLTSWGLTSAAFWGFSAFGFNSALDCSGRDVATWSVPLAAAGFFGCVVLSCDEMMAGSTGTPEAVAWPVGARIAGGVYLFPRPVG